MQTQIGKDTFPRHLWDIHEKGYTGMLRVEKNKFWKEIYFDGGLPVGGKSNILNECLGRLLVNSGKLPADKCEDSLVLMKGLKSRQGEVLVKMGVIKEEEITDWLRFQLKVRLLNLFGWKSAVYRFMDGGVQRFISLDEKIGKLIIGGINERHLEVEKELSQFKGMYLKKSDSFECVLKDFGFEASPFSVDNKMVDNILSMGKEPTSILYAFLLSGAVNISEVSEEWNRLNSFYEKIKGKNHFEILGLEPNCRDVEIKRAYYALTKLYHPDLFEEGSDRKTLLLANEIFCLIASAYEVLSDGRSRKEYQEQLKRGLLEGDATMASRILLAEIEFRKGQGYLRAKNFEAAIKSFQLSVDMNPDEGEFCAYLGWAVYNRQGRSSEEGIKAMEYVKKALSMNPRIPMACYFLGFIYKVEGNIEAALKEFNKALRLKPDLTEPLREIRLINMRKEKADVNEGKGKLFEFLRKKRDA